jgi:hypothetical protein
LDIIPVTSSKELERFVRVPMRLNARDPSYVAPLIMERMEALTPKTNPFFQHAEVQLWLAVKDGRDVGRISAQIDQLFPQPDPSSRAGHFGMIAAEDDPAIFAALFKTAEDWLKSRGCKRALGPFNLSINEETGLLVDGFNTPPMLLMGHDQPYVGGRVEEQGYRKVKDVYAYVADPATPLPRAVQDRVGRALPQGLELRGLDMKDYDKEITVMTEILNDAWGDNWGFTPTTEAETLQLAKSLKPVVDKRMVYFATIDGEDAGFGVCLPNVNEAIRDLNGKLFPFGVLKLLWRLKVSGVKTGRVPLMGVKRKFHKDFRGRLLPFILIEAMRRGARQAGLKSVEMSWILEDNKRMRAIIEAVDSKRYKTYRVYEKALA